MSEQEPADQDQNWTFKIGGQPFEMTPNNGSLYTFVGRVVLDDMEVPAEEFNHVYLIRNINPETKEITESRIFRQHPAYEQLSKFILEHAYPLFLNQRQIAESDIAAWIRTNFYDLGDYMPDEWGE